MQARLASDKIIQTTPMKHCQMVKIILPFLFSASMSADDLSMSAELCDSLHVKSELVSIKGIGRITDNGVFLSDATCPVAERKGAIVPASVRVAVVSFAREEDKKWVTKLRDRIERPFVQVVVRGILTCKANLKVAYDKNDDPDSGDGFGETGLIQCQMSKARVEGIWRMN